MTRGRPASRTVGSGPSSLPAISGECVKGALPFHTKKEASNRDSPKPARGGQGSADSRATDGGEPVSPTPPSALRKPARSAGGPGGGRVTSPSQVSGDRVRQAPPSWPARLTACSGTRVSAEAGEAQFSRRGARLTRRVREEPPPGELARVYFDRNATMSDAKRRGSAGMDRRQNAVRVPLQAVWPGWIAGRAPTGRTGPPGFHHRLSVAYVPQRAPG